MNRSEVVNLIAYTVLFGVLSIRFVKHWKEVQKVQSNSKLADSIKHESLEELVTFHSPLVKNAYAVVNQVLFR